jgi:hypothetical protein
VAGHCRRRRTKVALASLEPAILSTPIRSAVSPSNGRPGRQIDH